MDVEWMYGVSQPITFRSYLHPPPITINTNIIVTVAIVIVTAIIIVVLILNLITLTIITIMTQGGPTLAPDGPNHNHHHHDDPRWPRVSP